MNRLRLAVAGTGYFSRFHLDAWARIPEVEVVGICSLSREEAMRACAPFPAARAYDDFEAMLGTAGPDLVDIITPPHTHLAFIGAVTRRRLPAICQKPFCRSLQEAQAAVAFARQAGSLLVVHENFRFQPWHRTARGLLREGALGEPYQLGFRLRPGDGQGERAYLDRQPYFRTMPRLLVHETAIHHIDLFRFLFGEVESVYADLRRLNPVIAGEDAGLVLFRFAGGRRGLFDGNRLVDHAAANRRLTMGEMRIEGSAATLRLDGDGRLFLRRHGSNEETAVPFVWEDRGFGGDCVFALQRHVVDHLTRGTPVENAAAAYLRNLEIEEAVYLSADEGRIITLPPPS